ncbi:MAG TPA: LysM peptidoglycan-binding domain-containing protein [Candidatus Limosilactobacillus intestinipullorum]|nr:LysM peptidoglycan-binding domain-containing protein [Candidatus Limosilactobacillus intestinipullorum]
MVKKLKQTHPRRHMLAGALGAVGLLTLTAQTAAASEVTVKPGDTVWGIAQQHGLTTQAIEDANPTTIKKISSTVDLIQVGQRLTLPDGQNNRTVTTPTSTSVTNSTYTVQAGDQLAGVAQQFGVSTSQLRQWNQLTSDQLVVGQQLRVTGSPATSSYQVPVAGTGATVSQPTARVAISQPVTSEKVAATTATNQTPVVKSSVTGQPLTATRQSMTPVAASSPASSVNNVGVSESPAENGANQAATNAAVIGGQSPTSTDVTLVNQVVSAPTTQSQVPSVVSQQPVQSQAASQATVSQQLVQSQVASQATVSQQPVQSSATSQATTSQQPAQSQAAQPSQPTVTQPIQSPTTGNAANLQTGSVVSLATKIATSNSVPYVWGGNSLSGMDCSGFVDYVYAHAENKQLPHNSVALESYVNQHTVSQAQPGDLLFWGNHGSTYHVAIYTGNNQYAAAAKPGTNVAIYTLSPYFAPSFAGTVK